MFIACTKLGSNVSKEHLHDVIARLVPIPSQYHSSLQVRGERPAVSLLLLFPVFIAVIASSHHFAQVSSSEGLGQCKVFDWFVALQHLESTKPGRPCVFVHAFCIVASGQLLYIPRTRLRV